MDNSKYSELLKEALSNPGELSKCYFNFHNYSFLNQMLAYMQLRKSEPINTFKGWEKLGRKVKRGEKAICLIMPIIISKDTDDEKMIFIERNRWFGLSQTEGKTYVIPEIPNFNINLMLNNLKIKEEGFASSNGNTQGYALTKFQTVAINPLADHPFETLIHEVAHCLLHKEVIDGVNREAEAELISYLVSNILGRESNSNNSRSYIQEYLKGNSNIRVKKIFWAVDKILSAGRLTSCLTEAEAA